MIKLFKYSKLKTLIILGLLLLLNCNPQEKFNLEELKQQIIQTDISMSNLSKKKGFNTSILHFADENIVKLTEGSFPIIGKKKFKASCNKEKDIKSITWYPSRAEIAESGDLGYTWGNWKYIAQDTVFYGNYFTVWKRQFDGDWKVVLDGGNNSPNPIKN